MSSPACRVSRLRGWEKNSGRWQRSASPRTIEIVRNLPNGNPNSRNYQGHKRCQTILTANTPKPARTAAIICVLRESCRFLCSANTIITAKLAVNGGAIHSSHLSGSIDHPDSLSFWLLRSRADHLDWFPRPPWKLLVTLRVDSLRSCPRLRLAMDAKVSDWTRPAEAWARAKLTRVCGSCLSVQSQSR